MPSTRLFVAAVIGSSAANGRPAGTHTWAYGYPGPQRIVIEESSSATSARRRSRPRRYRSSKVRRPIGSASRGSACSPAGREAALVEGEVGASRQSQLPLAPGRARQPQVGVPSERHRDRSATGRDDRRVERELVLAGDDGDLDAVRERERRRVDVDRGAEARPAATGRASAEPPSRPAHEQAVDREAVAVGAEREAGQVDVDAGGPVAARRQPVRPRREQREAERGAGPQRRQAAGQRQVLSTPAAQRDAGHPEVGEERGRELAGGDAHRRLTPEPALVDGPGHDRHGPSRHGDRGRRRAAAHRIHSETDAAVPRVFIHSWTDRPSSASIVGDVLRGGRPDRARACG